MSQLRPISNRESSGSYWTGVILPAALFEPTRGYRMFGDDLPQTRGSPIDHTLRRVPMEPGHIDFILTLGSKSHEILIFL